MISQFIYATQFIIYRLFAKHKKGHGIHSPFLFNLIQNVFNKKNIDDDLIKVFKLHEKYIKSETIIKYNEIGAGSLYKTSKKQTLGLIIKRSSVNKKYAKLIYDLVRYFNPTNILEIGTSVGISTAYISQAAPNSNFTTIEGIKEKINIAKKLTKELNQLNIKFIHGNFDDTLKNIVLNYDKLDLVFFDGNHTKQSTINYFNICLHKTHNETVFVFDDIHWSKEMEAAWTYIKKHETVKLSVDLFSLGLIFFKKELSYEQYIIKY